MYQLFAKYYQQIFPFNQEIITQLQPWIKKGKKATDLGCATGELVYALFQEGMRVKGIDLDSQMIKLAHERFPFLDFDVMDMTYYLSQDHDIDLITCFGNTLPHLNPKQLTMFFTQVNHALAKDGTLIIQMLNYDKIMHEHPDHLPTIHRESLTFERRYHYCADHLIFETNLTIGNQTINGKTTLYPYLKNELIDVIEQQDLKVKIFSNLDRAPWSINHTHQTLIITHG